MSDREYNDRSGRPQKKSSGWQPAARDGGSSRRGRSQRFASHADGWSRDGRGAARRNDDRTAGRGEARYSREGSERNGYAREDQGRDGKSYGSYERRGNGRRGYGSSARAASGGYRRWENTDGGERRWSRERDGERSENRRFSDRDTRREYRGNQWSDADGRKRYAGSGRDSATQRDSWHGRTHNWDRDDRRSHNAYSDGKRQWAREDNTKRGSGERTQRFDSRRGQSRYGENRYDRYENAHVRSRETERHDGYRVEYREGNRGSRRYEDSRRSADSFSDRRWSGSRSGGESRFNQRFDERRQSRDMQREMPEEYGVGRENYEGAASDYRFRAEHGRDEDRRYADRPRPGRSPQREQKEIGASIADIPPSITPESLDGAARKHLRSLNRDNADYVARHLAYAGEMLDIDPEVAYQHARAAYGRAARIDIVREALGLTAYATERYSEALRELRTYRRMSDDYTHVAIEADAERGLGRSEKALRFIEGIALNRLEPQAQIELALVTSGARADIGDSEGGLRVVEKIIIDQLPRELAARVQLIKADRLEECGRTEEAAALREQWEPVYCDVGGDMMIDLDDVLDDLVDTSATHSAQTVGSNTDNEGLQESESDRESDPHDLWADAIDTADFSEIDGLDEDYVVAEENDRAGGKETGADADPEYADEPEGNADNADSRQEKYASLTDERANLGDDDEGEDVNADEEDAELTDEKDTAIPEIDPELFDEYSADDSDENDHHGRTDRGIGGDREDTTDLDELSDLDGLDAYVDRTREDDED
ncbi:hypothetical protein [Trueperella sp. LYQ143]|uniref:hypothetical protein n=1 Tax=Trueperella sp. LYQ143 TaxID=3391059 RepID=UPI0039839DC9